jgi:hypothetical protein
MNLLFLFDCRGKGSGSLRGGLDSSEKQIPHPRKNPGEG